MSKLLFATLFSGSSGNAAYISYGEDAILIDAGKRLKSIETALHLIGEDPGKIRAVFVTHEHSDHVSALPVLSKKYGVPIHMNRLCGETVAELPATAVLHEGEFDVTVGPFEISSFYIPHDSVCALGYTVRVGGKTIGIATDMGMLAKSVVNRLIPCSAALIECNYDPEMLRTGPYSPSLKARVGGSRGHLSNPDGALLAAVLAYSGAEHILLGHLSRENNTPEKALEAVRAEFERRGVSSHVEVARRDEPTVLFSTDL